MTRHLHPVPQKLHKFSLHQDSKLGMKKRMGESLRLQFAFELQLPEKLLHPDDCVTSKCKIVS